MDIQLDVERMRMKDPGFLAVGWLRDPGSHMCMGLVLTLGDKRVGWIRILVSVVAW